MKKLDKKTQQWNFLLKFKFSLGGIEVDETDYSRSLLVTFLDYLE